MFIIDKFALSNSRDFESEAHRILGPYRVTDDNLPEITNVDKELADNDDFFVLHSDRYFTLKREEIEKNEKLPFMYFELLSSLVYKIASKHVDRQELSGDKDDFSFDDDLNKAIFYSFISYFPK